MPTRQSTESRRASDAVPINDPDVIIPSSVRARAERAEALHRAVYPTATPTQGSQPEDRPQAGASAPASPSQPGAPAQPPEAPKPPEPQPQPQRAPQQSPEAPQEPAQEPHVSEEGWEHRYKTMKGRHDRLEAITRQMSDQITSLQNVIATMSATSTQQPGPPPHELQAKSLLSPQEVEDYGPEFLDVVGKKAQEVAGPYIQQLETKIQQLERALGGVGSTLAQTAQQRMEAELDHALPAWRKVNFEQRFKNWLALPDVFSGAIRHNLLKQAWDQSDFARVHAFFHGFLAEEAVGDPAYVAALTGERPNGQVPPSDTTGQQHQNGATSLEQFAAPGRAKSAASIVPAEKPIITQSEIKQFYRDIQTGKYIGREEDKARIEAMIFAANADGRIAVG